MIKVGEVVTIIQINSLIAAYRYLKRATATRKPPFLKKVSLLVLNIGKKPHQIFT